MFQRPYRLKWCSVSQLDQEKNSEEQTNRRLQYQRRSACHQFPSPRIQFDPDPWTRHCRWTTIARNSGLVRSMFETTALVPPAIGVGLRSGIARESHAPAWLSPRSSADFDAPALNRG